MHSEGIALLLLCAVALAHADLPQRTLSGKVCHCNPTEATSVCAQNGSDNELVVHENCNQFYKCFNGEAVPFFCPSNLLYNPLAELCDWPSNVDCGSRPIVEEGDANCQENNEDDQENDKTDTDGTDSGTDNGNGGTCNCNPDEAPGICAADGSDGVLVAHENCNQFYQCANGVPVALSCSGDLLYNPYTEQCDWAQNVDCGDRPIVDIDGGNNNGSEDDCDDNNGGETDNENGGNGGTGTCNCNPSEAPGICAADGSDGVLIAHENCNQFYQCANGVPVALSCSGDLLYNPYTEQCDWAQNVDCGDRPIVDIDGGNNNGSEDDCDDNNGGETDNENGDNGGTGTCNCNPGEAPGICGAVGSDGVLVAHENCNQFYQCANGVPVALSCSGDLLYNPYTEQCDWAQNVDCGDRPIVDIDGGNNNGSEDDCDNNTGNGDNDGETDSENDDNGGTGTCNCNPSEAPGICGVDGSDGVLVAHENCNQFYQCANGVPVALSCSGDLLYNPYTEQCDWAQNVDCGDRPIVDIDGGNNNGSEDDCDDNTGNGDNDGETDSENGDNGGTGTCNCNPSEAPGICGVDGSDGVLVAHENCNQFYQCANGVPVALSCSGDLLYNPYTEQCDWAQNVDCGDRPIVDIDGGNNNGSEDDCEDNAGNGENGGETDDGNDDNENGNGDNGGTGTCNCNPSEAPGICAADGSDGVLVVHENCNQFYQCANGVPVALSCSGDLLYNPYTEQCDWPQNVDCGDRPIIVEIEGGNNGNDDNGNGDSGNGNANGDSDCEDDGNGNENGNNGGSVTCNCNAGEAPSICAADGSNGVLVAHENCNQFYKCANGVPVAFKCNDDLLYNPYTEQCDWAQNVDCGDRPIVETDGGNNNGSEDDCDDNAGNGVNGSESDNETIEIGNENGDNGGSATCNCNAGEAPSICATSDSDGILIVHENCNQFYKCAHGMPVVFNCSGELLYNPYTEQCDWPQNIDCGDRPIIEIDEGNNNGSEDDCDDNTGNGENGGETDSENGDNGGTGTCNCNPSEAPGICAADGSDGVLVAHENCNQFYTCANGVPVVLSCSGDLLYNPYTERCDWAQNVDCGDRPVVEVDGGNGGETDSETGDNENDDNENGNGDNGETGTCNCNPGEAPGICGADGSDGVLVAHENCNQFYQCANGVPVAHSCSGDLLYNPYTERCDWAQNVDCGDRPIAEIDEGNNNDSEDDCDDNTGNEQNGGETDNENGDNGGTGTCNCNPTEAPGICGVDGSDGVLVAHENCNQFYKCANGVPVVLSCSGDLLYNPYTERCDWAQNVDCGDRPIVEIDGGNNNGSEDDCDDNVGNGENGDETDSENDDNGNDDNGNGNGDNGETGTCNCNPGEAPGICSADGSDGVLVAHENCNQFYTCANGIPVVLSCSGDLLYNPYTERCDWPQNVDCGDRPIVEIDGNDKEEDNDSDNNSGDQSEDNNNTNPNTDPSEAPSVCAADGSDGVLVAHENCDQFYMCSFGSPVALQCPSNLLYNPSIEDCDWPKNVECGDRVVPEPEVEEGGTCLCNSRQAPSICAGSDSNGKMIAHENCSQYYVCLNGNPVARSCPANLFYEPHTKQCNWPSAVDCDGREVSTSFSLNKHMEARRGIF